MLLYMLELVHFNDEVDNIHEHHMHAEYVEVPASVIDAIKATKAREGVIAVGTTSVRSLESAAQHALTNGTELAPFFGDTGAASLLRI